MILAVALGLSCAKDRDIPISSLPAELSVPSGATKVTARGEGGGAAVEYQLLVQFPAEAFVAEIKYRMERSGWKPADRLFLNPTIPSSRIRGWTYHFDGRSTPRTGVHQWQEDWLRQNGDVVRYSLRYSSPWSDAMRKLSAPGNSELHVTAFLIPSAQASAMAARAKELVSR